MNNIHQAAQAIASADALLIGASNGLSISEGYNIFACNSMFEEQFGYFHRKYGIRSVLDGVFGRFGEHLEFMELLVKLWVTDYKPTAPMLNLRRLAAQKPHFVLTTNADMHLEAAGFSPDNVFEIEGTMPGMLRGEPPTDKSARLSEFLSAHHGKRIAMLELGIGINNRLIKAPMMRLASAEPASTYIALNLPGELWVDSAIEHRSVLLPGDIAQTLEKLVGELQP